MEVFQGAFPREVFHRVLLGFSRRVLQWVFQMFFKEKVPRKVPGFFSGGFSSGSRGFQWYLARWKVVRGGGGSGPETTLDGTVLDDCVFLPTCQAASFTHHWDPNSGFKDASPRVRKMTPEGPNVLIGWTMVPTRDHHSTRRLPEREKNIEIRAVRSGPREGGPRRRRPRSRVFLEQISVTSGPQLAHVETIRPWMRKCVGLSGIFPPKLKKCVKSNEAWLWPTKNLAKV